MKPESPAEPFKRAVANTMRALGAEPELEISFGTEPAQLRGLKARLPLPGRDLPSADVAQTRGAADAFALRLAYHNEKTHNTWAPPGSTARAIFEAAEQARVEAIGGNAMKGVAHNLDASLQARLTQKGYARVKDRNEAPLAEAVGLMVRERLTGRAVPKSGQGILEAWREQIESKAGQELERLFDTIRDQQAFAKLTRRIVSDLGLGDELGADPGRLSRVSPYLTVAGAVLTGGFLFLAAMVAGRLFAPAAPTTARTTTPRTKTKSKIKAPTAKPAKRLNRKARPPKTSNTARAKAKKATNKRPRSTPRSGPRSPKPRTRPTASSRGDPIIRLAIARTSPATRSTQHNSTRRSTRKRCATRRNWAGFAPISTSSCKRFRAWCRAWLTGCNAA